MLLTIVAGVAALGAVAWQLSAPAFALGFLWLTSFGASWGQILHTEHLVALHLLVLAAAPSGRGASATTGWPLKVMSAVTVATYFVAGVAKLRFGGGLDWLTGDGLLRLVAHDNLRKRLLGDAWSPIAPFAVVHPLLFQVRRLAHAGRRARRPAGAARPPLGVHVGRPRVGLPRRRARRDGGAVPVSPRRRRLCLDAAGRAAVRLAAERSDAATPRVRAGRWASAHRRLTSSSTESCRSGNTARSTTTSRPVAAPGFATALDTDAAALIDAVARSGLRGRGGAGFPTATKWRRSPASPPRRCRRRWSSTAPKASPARSRTGRSCAQPLRGHRGRADRRPRRRCRPTVVVALKATFAAARSLASRTAIAEMEAAGLDRRRGHRVFEGRGEYLYGEETGAARGDRRPPAVPPHRPAVPAWGRRGRRATPTPQRQRTRRAACEMAGETDAPPALVNNVETMANVPGIIADGADWFRALGTDAVARHDRLHGQRLDQRARASPSSRWARRCARSSRRSAAASSAGGDVVAVLTGVANAVLRGDQLDTPLTYEAMAAVGSGLGAGGFIVLDDDDDLVAVAAGRRPLPRRRVVRAVHAVQAGRAGDRRPAGRALRGERPTEDDAAPLERPARHRRRRCPLLPRQAAADRGRQPARASPGSGRARTCDSDGEAPGPMLVAELLDIVDGQADLDEEFTRQAARLDLRRDRLRAVPRRPPQRPPR